MTHKHLAATYGKKWSHRIADVILCPDSARIKKVKDAGVCHADYQVMHNGIKVEKDGYCGKVVTEMMELNEGIHEPQEEAIFQEILPLLPKGATMMELGAYWGFYSLWFQQVVPEAYSYLIEGNRECLELGKRNFKRNDKQAHFLQAWIGELDNSSPDEIETICIDSLMKRYHLKKLNLLHSDIQGHELSMLKGASVALEQKSIDWIFISTHINHTLHCQCKEYLKENGYEIICSINLDETYADDGLIVAKSPLLPSFQPRQTLSKRPRKLLQALG